MKSISGITAGALLVLSLAFLGITSSSRLAHADGGPVLSAVSVMPSNTSALVTWTTDVPATSQLSYGTSLPYSNNTAEDISFVTSHSVSLTGLNPGTTYHVEVISNNSSGTMTASSDQTFTTSGTASSSSGSASLSLSSGSVLTGSSITVSGSGFNAYETITITVGGTNVGSFSADTYGNFSATVTVPSSQTGTLTVNAVGSTSGKQASNTLTISSSGIITTTEQQMQSMIAQLQSQVATLQSQVVSLQAQVNAYANGGSTSGSGFGTGGPSTGLPAGDSLYTGTLSNLSGSSFTLTASSGTTYTVNVTSGATLWNNARNFVTLSNYSNGDSIRLDGFVASDGSITADVVRDTSI